MNQSNLTGKGLFGLHLHDTDCHQGKLWQGSSRHHGETVLHSGVTLAYQSVMDKILPRHVYKPIC